MPAQLAAVREKNANLQSQRDVAVREQARLRAALEKISDPRKRDHTEPDAYTQLGCVMHIAQEALAGEQPQEGGLTELTPQRNESPLATFATASPAPSPAETRGEGWPDETTVEKAADEWADDHCGDGCKCYDDHVPAAFRAGVRWLTSLRGGGGNG